MNYLPLLRIPEYILRYRMRANIKTAACLFRQK